MANLPEELIIEIMSWLPPESLFQSKCVNKYWNSLITSLLSDPSFVSKHLQNLNDNKNIFSNASHSIALTCLRMFHTPVQHYKELFSLLSLSSAAGGGESLSSATELLTLPTIPDEKDMSCVTASHCDGVICLADYYHNIILSNPARNESRALPRPGLVERFVLQGVGFGRDALGEDYKVVRFGRDVLASSSRVEVYSLRSGTWKEVGNANIENLGTHFPSLHVELYFKGCFYWLMSGPSYVLRRFDFSEEVFRDVAVPEGVRVERAHWTGLGVWEGAVALFVCVGERGVVSTEVWAMSEGDWVWRKRLAIGPLEGVDCPLGFWSREELLMRASNFKEVVSYNIRSGELRSVSGVGLDGIGCRAFSYVKSLVRVV